MKAPKSAEALIAQNDLRFIGDALRASGKIRHFANANDFLLADGDIEWLTEVLGAENVEFFPTGGHLGGLFKPEVQQLVMDAVRDLVEPAGSKTPSEPSASSSMTAVPPRAVAARPLELLTQ